MAYIIFNVIAYFPVSCWAKAMCFPSRIMLLHININRISTTFEVNFNRLPATIVYNSIARPTISFIRTEMFFILKRSMAKIIFLWNNMFYWSMSSHIDMISVSIEATWGWFPRIIHHHFNITRLRDLRIPSYVQKCFSY